VHAELLKIGDDGLLKQVSQQRMEGKRSRGRQGLE